MVQVVCWINIPIFQLTRKNKHFDTYLAQNGGGQPNRWEVKSMRKCGKKIILPPTPYEVIRNLLD